VFVHFSNKKSLCLKFVPCNDENMKTKLTIILALFPKFLTVFLRTLQGLASHTQLCLTRLQPVAVCNKI